MCISDSSPTTPPTRGGGGKIVAAQLTSLILSILKHGKKKNYLQEKSDMYVEKEGRDG